MEFSFLPKNIRQALKNVNLDYLYEIRLRNGYPIKINYQNDFCYLSKEGTSLNKNNAIVCSIDDINHIISCATEHSLYAFNDKIKDGFITVENGIRIGICGECVYSNNQLQTIKNFTSLNIRVAHEIKDCAEKHLKYIVNNGVINNTLIVSPPRLGKTTLLKDIASKLNDINKFSILIIDERGEFENVKGENIDSIKFCNKYYAFNYAIRSMSPSIVITDELLSQDDWICAKNVLSSGIKIIASCHSDGIDNLIKKEHFINDIFDRYIILSKNNIGKIEKVFNKDFQVVWK